MCLITPNNRWKQISSMNLNYFDVSSSLNYVDFINIWSNLPIGHFIHLNYHQKYHGSEETTHAPQSRHNGSDNNFFFYNGMYVKHALVMCIYRFWNLKHKSITSNHLCPTIATQYKFHTEMYIDTSVLVHMVPPVNLVWVDQIYQIVIGLVQMVPP